MAKTVLALDVGAATITAACAGGDLADPVILKPKGREAWPSAVYVADDGTLLTQAADHYRAATVITRFTRLLGQPAQVISGAARHADTLVAAALAPALAAAAEHLRSNVDLVVATYPSVWPEPIVDAYRFAISEFAPADSMIVPWSDAIAASTMPPDPFVDCPVTSIDIGARSASVTMVRVDQAGRARTEYSITNPRGGWAQVVRPIIAMIGDSTGRPAPAINDETWWDQAIEAFSRARTDPAGRWATATSTTPNAMNIELPAPVGPVSVDFNDVSALIVEQLTQPQGTLMADAGFPAPPADRAQLSLLDQLLHRDPVTARWTVPGNPHASVPIVEVTGGFADDVAVQRAVREVTGAPVLVAPSPAHAAAWGAARIGVKAGSRLIGSRR